MNKYDDVIESVASGMRLFQRKPPVPDACMVCGGSGQWYELRVIGVENGTSQFYYCPAHLVSHEAQVEAADRLAMATRQANCTKLLLRAGFPEPVCQQAAVGWGDCGVFKRQDIDLMVNRFLHKPGAVWLMEGKNLRGKTLVAAITAYNWFMKTIINRPYETVYVSMSEVIRMIRIQQEKLYSLSEDDRRAIDELYEITHNNRIVVIDEFNPGPHVKQRDWDGLLHLYTALQIRGTSQIWITNTGQRYGKTQYPSLEELELSATYTASLSARLHAGVVTQFGGEPYR